jgi:hypothetical protein
VFRRRLVWNTGVADDPSSVFTAVRVAITCASWPRREPDAFSCWIVTRKVISTLDSFVVVGASAISVVLESEIGVSCDLKQLASDAPLFSPCQVVQIETEGYSPDRQFQTRVAGRTVRPAGIMIHKSTLPAWPRESCGCGPQCNRDAARDVAIVMLLQLGIAFVHVRSRTLRKNYRDHQ